MQKQPEQTASGGTDLAARWRRMRAAYRLCNQATHHVLGFTLKLLLLLYFAFGILLLVLRYLVLPNIDHYKDNIERAASKALGNPVTIARVYASWTGLHPNLFLGDVHLHDKAGNRVLELPSVSAVLSWWSVAALDVRFQSLELIRPSLDVRREADGKLYAAGVYIDLDHKGDGEGADWLLAQQMISIREGKVAWTDHVRDANAAPLALDNVNLVLRNKWRRHQFLLQATPPAELGSPLDVRADFVHPTFSTQPSDVRLWHGEVYVDVQKADLAAWKSYVHYPFELQSGAGSVRAWVSLDHAKLAGFTADVGLADVSATLAPGLPALDLEQVHGRISAREEIPTALRRAGQPAFGALGHSISLNNFSLRTRGGVDMAPTNLTERFVAAAGKSPERMEVSASVLDLQALSTLAVHLPLSEHQRQLLADVEPRGRLLDVSATWFGAYPALHAYQVKGKLDKLGMKPRAARLPIAKTAHAPAIRGMPGLPGFEGLSGTLEASDKGGKMTLDSNALVLRLPDYFAESSMPFDKLSARASWSFEGNERLKVELDGLDFVQEGLSGTLSGNHVVPLDGKSAGRADFTGRLDGFDVKKIGRYLPLQTPESLRHWLTGALEDGRADNVSLRLRGDLAHFPFKGGPEKGKGEFRIGGKITDGKLNYDPGVYGRDGKSPLWPLAEKIMGSFLFEGTRMEIRGDTARTGNVDLLGVKAVIADLSVHEQLLEIEGNASGAMQDYVSYVAASPVLEWISHFTDELQASGNGKLALKLQLPLAALPDSKVQGVLQLQGNDVVLWNDMPPVLASTGKLEFNEKGFTLNNLVGTMVGGPLAVTGGTQKDGSILVRLNGAVTTDGLRKTWPVPEVARVADHLAGGARYAGVVLARDHRYAVTIDSSLAGLGLDFPAPLVKGAADVLPLRLTVNGAAANDAGVMRDDIRLALGGGISGAWQRQKVGKGPWRLVRGGIGVNAPAPEPDSGMALNANLKIINVDQWIALTDQIAGPYDPNAAPHNPDGADLAQYVTLDAIAARANELVLVERKLDNVVAGVTRQKGIWQANIESPQVAGYVTWSELPSGHGLGKVTARLSSLIIPASSANDVKDLLETQGTQPTIPALDIIADRFELFNKQLGYLELQAHNAAGAAAVGSVREWRVSKLLLANPDGELKGTGRWAVGKDGQHQTHLTFDLDMANAGRLLDRFGFVDTLRHGKGTLSGEIAWKGLPYAFDIPSLSGQLNLDVSKGQFLKQDPGAAKLLGVLSLQALPRLLKFDFNDVFAEGLAFDGITATAAINRGIAHTDNLKMVGVAATVLMEGSADIVNESTNLHVVVIPQVNFGTAPLVYALAVNPVVGLGGFLAQLFLSMPVTKALTYEMQVTGPWKAPVMTKLDGQRATALRQAKPVKESP